MPAYGSFFNSGYSRQRPASSESPCQGMVLLKTRLEVFCQTISSVHEVLKEQVSSRHQAGSELFRNRTAANYPLSNVTNRQRFCQQ